MSGEIDRYPVSQLPARYGDLARSAFYKRMDALGIKPVRIGARSYVSAEDVALLDELHRFIQGGGSAPEFVEMMGLNVSEAEAEADPPEESSGLANISSDMINLIRSLTAEIVANLNPPANQVDPLAYYQFLEQAVQNKWELKSSEIEYLLKRPVPQNTAYGQTFREAGFLFRSVGRRSDGEVAWIVSKG